uniref:C2H2-type domain-containing protein n=2 Tax=Cacopsylla melanoneura TaxID=428564 RepID=A0A8D8WXE8_9HEMI
MTRAILCVAIVVIAGFLFTSGKQVKQTKKQRQIPDQFQIEIGDVPRWLYRHAYNVSINGHLKTDKERVPSILRFNRTMLPADLYEQVYLHKFIIPPDFKPRPDRIDPRNLTFDEMRKIEDEEFFGTEPPYAWIERGWNYTCEVCRMEFPYAGDYYLHVHHHYVTNYSATPIMNWTIIQMQNEQYRNESERGAIDYWHKVSRGELYPDYETVPTVPTVTVILDEPIICHICNASIYNTSEYNPHLLAHVDYENEKMGNLTIKHSRPTKSFDDIHFRKVYVEDSLNTQEEAEYEEAQRIIKEASHSLNTDEIMERTQNLSINKRLLEFGVDSRGFTITWPRIKLAPRMEAFNDSDSVRGDEPIFEDPDINRYHDEKRKKWEEDYLRRRKAQEKGNPDFATYSVESNETAAERRALNITRRKRKYTPKLIYIRRKRHVEEENVRRKRRNVEADATTKKRTPKTTTPYNILLGEKKLRRVNSNKRKKLDVVYRQQLNKIIQKAKQYMKKFNQTKYPTTQSIYEKVHIYKLKEKFKKLNWFLYGLDNYTVPSDVDIDTFTNTPLSTERPLIYKRVEKRDLRKAQMRDYNQHKRRIDELKTLVEKAEIMNAEIQAEGQDGTVIRKKRNVNLEDINLQEIENALKPLSVEKGLETKDEMKILAYQKSLMDSQRQNYKKLLFKRDVNDKLNDDDKNQNESIEFDHSADHYTKKQNGSIEFDNSAPYRKGKRSKRDVLQDTKKNLDKDTYYVKQIWDTANENRARSKRFVTPNEEQLMQCEFYKNLLDENKAIDTEERQMVRKVNEEIKADKEKAAKMTTEAIVDKESAGDAFEVRHFEGGKEIRDDALTDKLKKSIRNKRYAQVHDHAKCEENLLKKEMCEELQPRRVKREPRFRKDRLPTKKKKRSTCPFFKRSMEFWNCTDCSAVYSLEGELAEHQWKKHNGSACFISYDTKDIEDEYHSWNYDQVWRNDTIETTHEKWVKRCKVPNQKRHRYINRGCTKSYRENMLGGGGGNDNRKKRSVRQRRSLVKPPNILYNERENPKTSVAENEKRKVRDVRKARAHKVLKRSLELMDSDGNKLSPSKLTPSLEAKYGPIFKGKYDHMHDGKSLELRRTEEMSEFSGDKNVTPHRLNETLLRYIETLDTNETLAQALENRDRQGRMKREVVCEDLTDELGSNVRDESRKYHWTNTKSWEWRIKNVNIREYMYRIMENRMKKRTLEPDPDAVLYDMDDASHDKLKHPSYESRERRVAQFYADNGHFSGRTGSDLEIYQDSNPNLFDMREVGPPVTPDDYMYKPKPEIFANRHKKYTNVKPGSRTLRPEGHSTKQYPNPIEFTDKKDYYDSDIEVAKSQFRFRRDLNNDDQNPRLPSVKNKRKFRNRRSAGNLKMIQINETGNSAEIRRQLNLSANPSSAELRALKEKMIYHQRLLDMASAIDTAELSNYSPPNETSYGQYSMVASHKLNPRGGRSKRAAGPNNIEYDSDYSSALQRFEAIDTHPELFAKLYPSQAVYTPYTFYPTTLFGLTDHPDPNATYAWIEKSGPDTEERMNLRQLNALDQSVKDELEYEMASNAMKENTQINSEDYRDWLEWQRNRSLEDQNSYNKIMWTCKFHPCTFNASVEDQVGDHIFVDHFTYPKNYKEAATYVMETTDLGWERLTNVDYLLHRYSDENLHPDIKEDFDIFTGIFDDLSFPTIHPNYTLPSKPKQTRFKPTEHPDMETVPITKPKKHHSTPKHPSKDHHHPHGHPTTSHHPTIDHIAKGHHHRQKRADDYNLSKLPQPPHDSCDKGQPGNPNSEGRPRRRYYRQVNSEQKERHRRNLDDSLPMPTPSKELSGYDGSAFLKTGEVESELMVTEGKDAPTTLWDMSSWQSEYEPENITKFHFSEETIPPKYRCKYCGDLFHTEKRLLSHKAKKHPRKHTPTTTPCIKMMKNFFTLDSELDLSKNYDFVFSEPDNGSFVQHRPILEDSFYQSFDPTDPDHHVNPASYQEIEDYCDWVFNKSRWQQCQACGKNISDDEAEAHFRKHVSNIKKDYFDELPPEYMDRCFKEAHWNESWETIHHKLKRQYEENRIVDSVFEPETYRCKRCNTTFATHEKTYAHLMEHKHNDSRRSASEAAIRSQLKRERARFEPTTRKEMKEWNPDYIDYLKNVKKEREKRSVNCIEVDNPTSNQSVPVYKIFESGNNSKERIENITPDHSFGMFTAEIDKLRDNQDVTRAVPIFVDGTAENNNKAEKEITGTDTDGKKDDHAERSISENLQTQVKDTIENSRKETQKPIDNTDKSVPLKDTNSENTNAKDPENAREPEYIPEVPDCQINFEEDDNDEEDNNSEEDEDTSDSDANSTDEEGDSTKPVKKRFNSNKAEPSLEEFIAKMKNTYRLLTSQNILNNQSTLLRRIEKMIGLNTDPGQAVFHRRNKRFIDRVVDSDYSDNVTYEVLADRWVSTECNVVDKLSKKFNTTIKDKGKGHKLLETDVSRLIEDFGVGQHPNLTSEENRLRLRSFRECMKIIDFKETRSEQDYHVMYDDHLDYMRLKTESPTLSPSDESLLRSRPRNEYSDYEDLVSDKWNCEECNTTFDNYTAFLEHMKKPKEPKWPYLIDVENAKMKKSIENFFTTKSYWVNECFECKQHFNTRQELLDHINAKGYDSLPHVEKVDQTVKCVHCDVAFTNVQKYLEHRAVLAEAEQRLKNLTGGEKEFCGDCKKYFDNHEDFLEHLNVERAKDYEDMPKYVCKKCNFTYLDSISLGLHMNKIHPQEDEKNRKRRKRRNCREENMVKVNVVPEHMDYAIMKHIVMKTVNKNRRKKRDTEHKKSQKKNRIKKRELKLKRVMKVKRESLDKKMNNKLKRDATIFMNKMEEVAQVKNKGHNIRKRAIDNGKRILKENIVPKDIVSNNKAIVNKRRKKRSVDDLMDKIDKEYEKYIMYKYDPQFNVHHPILMFEEYRYALLKGYAAHETLLEKEERKKEKELLEASAKNQDLKAKEKDKWMDFVEEGNTYAYGPAMFGTTWSYNLWPTIRYNVLGPGKSYNNTQYFNQYYYNQTIKQHIKAIFREYFAEPLNASYPVPTFVEPERDTEELESLARKDRRKRSVDNDIINDNLDEELNDNVDGNIDNEIHGSRKKRHSIDRPCFNDQMRERLTIGKKIDKKCKCKNKDAEKIGGQQETNKMHDNVNHIDDTVKHIDGNNAMKNDMNDKIELNDTVHDIHMKRIKQRTPKATTPKTPRSTYRKRENDDDDKKEEDNEEVKDLLNEDAAQEPLGIIAEAVHGLQAPEAAARRCRARRQVRVDVMNNNTIQKINWEKLAKILVAENRNLSNLLDKHLPKKTTPMRKYECKHCGDRFPGLQPYVEHMIMHEKEFDMELSYPEEFNITCDHCYQIFSTEDAIHEHNLERLRILKEKEAADYVELNRTTRIKRFSPYEHPFTLGIMENQDNTFWNPTTPVYTDDPAEDKYYCYYCKDMMINTKEFVEHKKWHEVSRKQAKEAYIVRKKKIEDKIREDFDIKGSIHM